LLKDKKNIGAKDILRDGSNSVMSAPNYFMQLQQIDTCPILFYC
jgi:hypothetical protein